jgi:hypothetical protein
MLNGMRRACPQTKPAHQRGRSRHCQLWSKAACAPQRTRVHLLLPLCVDPCLGARRRRFRSVPGY